MTYLSSSATISRGVSERTALIVRSGREMAMITPLQFFDGEIRIRIDANVGSDAHRFFDDLTRVESAVFDQRARRRHRKAAAGSHRDDTIIRLDEVASARQEKRGL